MFYTGIMTMTIIFFFIGLIVGSSINSFIWRYQNKKTYAGRSMCPACKHKINWYDNIPVISWFLLSGKCRYCKKSISVQYPIVEVLTGFSFAIISAFSMSGIYLNHLTKTIIELGLIFQFRYLARGILELALLFAITSVLIVITIYDYKTREIPNGFNLTFIILSLAILCIKIIGPLADIQTGLIYLLTGALAFSFFYAFVFFSKETWMGGGDAKMALGMGFLLGPMGTFLAILLASVTGSVYGITQIIIQDKDKNFLNPTRTKDKRPTTNDQRPNRHQVPFGPFLALGTYISMLFGPQIIDWYVKIILSL
jgi:prepilin signal peptidase PulO-like enzyme (type II secretory pathway)